MTNFFFAYSEDGNRFKLHRDQTWERDVPDGGGSSINFRNCKWGSDPAAIKLSEGSEPIFEDNDSLMYDTSIAGFPVHASFMLVSNKFYTGAYAFRQEHADSNRFVDDFDIVKELLAAKYGPPASDDDLWRNDLFRNDWDQRGMAVSRGDLSKFVKWEDAESRLTLQLTGDNYEIKMFAFYRSKGLDAVATAARNNELLQGL